MAHAKADFMGSVMFGGPGETKPQRMKYDQATLKSIVESGKLV